jgi:16S rRNA processing protein RimM
MVIIDNDTGDIVALAGGVGEKTDFLGLNRATMSKLQVGSSMKPLGVYAPAFELGVITPATVIHDMPLYYKEDGTPMEINSWRFQKGAVLLNFNSIDTMELAEKLKFTKLYAKKEDLPKLPKGEYYFFELIGLKAILPDGEELGEVTDVIENNASNLLEIKKTDGDKVLVPNIPVFVSEVDTDKGKIFITPIEGLI